MAGDVSVEIDILAGDDASGSVKNVSDSLDELNKKTNTKLNDELKKTGDKAKELGGNFKEFKAVSSNAMNTAVSSGAITGELGKITPIVGGVTEAFGTLLQTGFTPVGIAITGLGVALPFLISTFSNMKPSLDSLSQSFDSFKKSINDANAKLFDAQSQMRNIRNSGLDVYLREATQYFQDIEKANKRVKDNATQNAKEIASQYIKEFEKAGVQSSKVFEAFKISDDVKANIEDFKSSITQGVFDSQSSVFKNGEEAVNKYGGTIKATFQSEEIVKYFEKSKLAGKDFDSAFSWISNKILGLNNSNSKSFQDASTVQGKFYLDLKKQMQDYYDAYKINNDNIRAENVKFELETAQRRKAGNEKYLSDAISFAESNKNLTMQQYDELLLQQRAAQENEINLLAISNDKKRLLINNLYTGSFNKLKSYQEQINSLPQGGNQGGNLENPLIGGGGAMDFSPQIKQNKSAWDEFTGNFSLSAVGKEIDKLNTKMDANKEMANLMHAGVTGAAKGMTNAWVRLGATGKLSLAGLDKAIKQSVAVELQALSAKAMVWAIYETARGFAALFMNPAEAGAHFQSAGLFAATAVAAGVGAGVIGGSGSSAGAGGGSSANDTPKEPSATESQKQDLVVNQNIIINGDIDKSNLDKLKKTQETMEYQIQQSMVA